MFFVNSLQSWLQGNAVTTSTLKEQKAYLKRFILKEIILPHQEELTEESSNFRV